MGTNNDKLVLEREEQNRELDKLRTENQRLKEDYEHELKRLKGSLEDKNA